MHFVFCTRVQRPTRQLRLKVVLSICTASPTTPGSICLYDITGFREVNGIFFCFGPPREKLGMLPLKSNRESARDFGRSTEQALGGCWNLCHTNRQRAVLTKSRSSHRQNRVHPSPRGHLVHRLESHLSRSHALVKSLAISRRAYFNGECNAMVCLACYQ